MFWLRLVVVLVLVALLVVQVMRSLDQSYWRQSELDTAVYRFGQTAMLVNSEWLRRGRQGPVEVQIGGPGADTRVQRSVQFHVHSQGWPLAEMRDENTGAVQIVPRESMSDSACDALWITLSQAPDLLNRGLKGEWHADNGLCLYRHDDEKVFTYRLRNGHLKTL